MLKGCLDWVDQLGEKAQFRAPAARARAAARSSCRRPSTVPLSLRVNRVEDTVSYRVRQSMRRDPRRGLRVSCRRAPDAAMTLRIRTRSRRTTLRKLLGPRLVLGLHRAHSASGVANVETTFNRR